jgi:hypothetical protein
VAGPGVTPGFAGGAGVDWPNAMVPAVIAINNKNCLALREPNSELRSLNGRRFDLTLNIQSSFFRNPPLPHRELSVFSIKPLSQTCTAH